MVRSKCRRCVLHDFTDFLTRRNSDVCTERSKQQAKLSVRGLSKQKLATILFALVLVAFVIAKLRVLGTPFFWDELGVYGHMSFHLADVGPSLHPKAVDQWVSRGHPLLYPYIISLACHWFGTSVYVAHFTNLIVSTALLLSIFYHVSHLQNTFTGLITTSILVSQPIFFAQSGMVLPEIALALSLWWCTWTYYKGQLVPFVIVGSVALLIKEPAVVWIGTIFLYDVFFGKTRFSFSSLQWLLPLLTFGIFIYIQKKTWGWYLFPYHSNSIDFTPVEVYNKFLLYSRFLFWEQGRGVIPLSIFLSVLVPLIRYGTLTNYWQFQRRAFVPIGITICAAYLIFCCLTFHLWRYVLPLLPFISLVSGTSIYQLSISGNRYFAILIFLGCTLLPISKMQSDHFVYDCDMSYLRAVEVEKKALQFMIDNGIYVQDKFSVNLPLVYAVQDPRFGYLPDSIPAYRSHPISERTSYAVALTPGTSLENPNNFPIELYYERYYGDIKMSIYKVVVDSAGLTGPY